jgi:hypothetical protein
MSVLHKSRRNLFLLKETTPGTWMTTTSVFVAANATTPYRNIKVKAGNKEVERNIDGSTLLSSFSLFYGENVEITFDTDDYTSGAAGTVVGTTVGVGVDLLWQAGFFGPATVVASTSVTRKQNSSALTKISAGVELISEDGTTSFRIGVAGAAVTSIKEDFVVGAQGVIHWTLKGKVAYESATPVFGLLGTSPVAITTRDTVLGNLPQFKGLTFSVGSVSRMISKCSLDWGISAEEQTDITDATSIQRFILSGLKPTLTIDPETTPRATADDFAKFFAGTSESISFILGTGAGKVIAYTLGAAQRKTATLGERSSITTTETVFRLNKVTEAGDDAISRAET